MPKAPGYDNSKPATGYSDKNSSDDADKPIVSYWESSQILIDYLYRHGYKMLPRVGGSFCNHDVYVKGTLDLPGITLPDNFWYWKPLGSSDVTGFKKFLLAHREQICNKNPENAANLLKMILEIVDDPFGFSKLARATQGSVCDTGVLKSISGQPGYHKFIPGLEWFSEEIRSLDYRELLSILPDSEATVYSLILGRAVVGYSGEQLAEGYLEHSNRSYALMVGYQGGLGKSTLLGYIQDAMATLGYRVTQYNTNDTNFGWGEIAEADLAIIDDLTEDIQGRVISSNTMKILASNGKAKVEDKGEKAYNVRAKCAILGATNAYVPSHFITMDDGSRSRVNLLYSFNRQELRDLGQGVDLRVKQHWELLAESLGTSTTVLAMYLLRCCANKFLEATGYDPDSPILDKGTDKLQDIIEYCRTKYILPTDLVHVKELVDICTNMYALAATETFKNVDYLTECTEELQECIDKLTINPTVLLAFLDVFENATPSWFTNVNLDPNLFIPKEIDPECRQYISAKRVVLKAAKADMSSDDLFRKMTRELRSKAGIKYPEHISRYMVTFIHTRRDIWQKIQDFRGRRLETRAKETFRNLGNVFFG